MEVFKTKEQLLATKGVCETAKGLEMDNDDIYVNQLMLDMLSGISKKDVEDVICNNVITLRDWMFIDENAYIIKTREEIRETIGVFLSSANYYEYYDAEAKDVSGYVYNDSVEALAGIEINFPDNEKSVRIGNNTILKWMCKKA